MSRANLKIAVGTYTGDGIDSRNLTGIGFTPAFVMVRGAAVPVFRTKCTVGDLSSYAGSGTADAADLIQAIITDGFQVGTLGNVNTNAVPYYWFAIWHQPGNQGFVTGRYQGSGGDNRSFTDALRLKFTPNALIVKSTGANNAVFKTSDMIQDQGSANCGFFSSTALAADKIQQIIANGFELGTGQEANGSGNQYYYNAFKNVPGAIKVGTYTGSGATLSITDVGFQPDVIIVKSAGGNAGVLKISTMPATQSSLMNTTTNPTDAITAIIPAGFTLGTNAAVNTAATVYYYLALKAGNFETAITRNAI